MAVTIDVIGSGRKVVLDLPEPKEAVLHEVVAWQLSKRRRGTAATKTRAEITGSTAKIYPQKGTGRARHGSRKAPIFVGGSKAFGPQPRDYGYTLPKRVRRLGLEMALAARAQDGKLTLVEAFDVREGKTKEFVPGPSPRLRRLGARPARHRRRHGPPRRPQPPWVNVMPSRGLNVYDILRCERLIADAAIFGEEADA
jgi:large subunit ribosomal protein L4